MNRLDRIDPWIDDEGADQAYRPLNREQALAVMVGQVRVSPWRVVWVQMLVGAVIAISVGLLTGQASKGWSALYGAITVVIPAALMARGMTSKLSSMAPGVSAVSFMLWEFGKIASSVALLMLAPKLVANLNWPVLLVTLIVCIKVYWVALSWRGRRER